MKNYYVYILCSKQNGTLYIGVTNDLQRRIFEHKNKIVKGFTKKYKVAKLVYFEEFGDVKEAIQRETVLKRWKREWKMKLIDRSNPFWKDLAQDW